MELASALFAKAGKSDRSTKVSNWVKDLMSLPLKVDKIVNKGSIYDNQCFLTKSLVNSVAQNAGLWFRCFPEILLPELAAVGEELRAVLERGVDIIRQLSTDKASPGLLLIILGSLGKFDEIVDDVRRYCQMINKFILQFQPQILETEDEIRFKRKLILDQIENKVEIDCNTLQAFLSWGYERDKLALINNLKTPNYVPLGKQFRYYVSYGLIPVLETGIFLPNCINSRNLVFQDELGRGSFGNVYKASWFNIPVAVKEFNEECSSFDKEVEVFSTMVGTNSSHIVQLLGHCEMEKTVNDETKKRRCLVLELMDKSLIAIIGSRKLKPLSKTVDILLQISKAAKYLHDNGVIYRDMKPANILVKEREDKSLLIKLADFGASKINFETGNNTEMRGTMMYMAPELLESKTDYNKSVDVFSFGVVCSQILTGQKKLRPVTQPMHIRQVRDELRQKVLEMDIPQELKDLVDSCWEQEEHRRPTFPYICDLLWFVKEKLLISESTRQNLTNETKHAMWLHQAMDLFPRFRYIDICSESTSDPYFKPIATLSSDGSKVEVQDMLLTDVDEIIDFFSVIARVRHKNLLGLRGFCYNENENKLSLVYEYMEGSLDEHLFSGDGLLSWRQRYEIVKGVADGLAFLHSASNQRIVHRDVKPANVILDSEFGAHLARSGIELLIPEYVSTEPWCPVGAGTPAYVAPECFSPGVVTQKADVYGFGILLLEVASGKQASDEEIREENRILDAHFTDDLLKLADPRLESDYDKDEMRVVLTLGFLCIQLDPDLRPSMRDCCQILNCAAIPPDLFRPELILRDTRKSRWSWNSFEDL